MAQPITIMKPPLPQEIGTEVFSYIDAHQNEYVDLLASAVAIPSVSQQQEFRPQTKQIVEFYKNLLESKGAKCQLHNIGDQTFPDGTKLELPPILTGFLEATADTQKTAKIKKTLCIYGHIDVQPALISDGWNTEPFKLIEKNGVLYGRGSSDDKGPVTAWINMIDAFQKCSVSLPVNLKFIFEAMEESGSIGLNDFIHSLKNSFLKDVDYFCISDNYWLGQSRPCLSYGLRGNVYFSIQVEGARKDLHSGIYGGVVHEAMIDLVMLLNKLTDHSGNILVPNFMDQVLPLTMAEQDQLQSLDFDEKAYQDEIGTSRLRFDSKVQVLAHRWRYPCLSIHGIEGCFSTPGVKTVIPSKVIGKFSIRIVPNQDPEDISKKIQNFLFDEIKKLNSPNIITVDVLKSSKPWLGNINDQNFTAGKLAIENVFGVTPDFTREGGTIPVTLTLQEVSGKSVLLLPIGKCDDGAHSQNEKIDRQNYINGSKVMAAYIYHLSLL